MALSVFPLRYKNYKKRCLLNMLHKAYGLDAVKATTNTESYSTDQNSLFYSSTCIVTVPSHTNGAPKHVPNLQTLVCYSR